VLGVPQGPERKRLVAGQSVTLAGGTVVHPDDVLGPSTPGPKLVCIGDSARLDDLVAVTKGADMLVCECTYMRHDVETARRYSHVTAAESAELAREAGVHMLVLNHVSRRYPARRVLEEARSVFPNTVVADDFDHFEVRRQDVRRVERPRPGVRDDGPATEEDWEIEDGP
jgi:ribonuclease Z